MDWLWIAALTWVALVLPLGVLTGFYVRRLDRSEAPAGDNRRRSPSEARSVPPPDGVSPRILTDARRRLPERGGRSSPARRAARQSQVVGRSWRPGRRRGPRPPQGGAGP